MSTTDEVIDSIDHTLRDFGTSPDAMRWQPEPPPPGWRVAPVAWPQFTITVDVSPFVAAMRSAARQMREAFGPAMAKVAETYRLLLQVQDVAVVERRHQMHTAYRARARRRTRSHR